MIQPTDILLPIWIVMFAGTGLYYTTWEPKSRRESIRVTLIFIVISGLTGGFVHTALQISVVGTLFFIPIVSALFLLPFFLTSLHNPL